MASGGVAVFPADTVYGLACDPELPAAVQCLYALKGRAPEKPSALLFFSLAAALEALPELGPRTRALLERLLPGALTVVVANPQERYPLSGGGRALGVRVPVLPAPLAALAAVHRPVLQSSANAAGEAEARRLRDVPEAMRRGADLVLDGGDLPGTPSTVIDLTGFEVSGEWAVRRVGAVTADAVATAVAGV